MTSVLNFTSSSSAETVSQEKGTTSILSNAKSLTTFIIQPPSTNNTSDLLAKRFKTAHIGDLLMKKVKSQTANTSENNSLNQSPTTKRLKEAMYDTSDNQSMIEEEVESPAVSSFETTEKLSVLFPQRSLSTPIFSNLNVNRDVSQSNQRQLQNALDTLQKRLVEYQVLNLRDTLIKAALLSQGPLKIPSLNASDEPAVNPVENIISKLQNDDEDLEVYYGEVEYPLLHLAPKGMQVEEAKKKVKAGKSDKLKVPKGRKAAKMSDCSSPAGEQDDSLLESLTATRAGTQRSESEMTVNLRELSEQVAEFIGQKGKKSKKASKNEENFKVKETVKKNKKAEKVEEKKQKAKRGAKEALLSPVLKGKRMTERRKNKWQDETELKI